MPFTKLQKLKLGLIKSWPLNNKLRLANWILPEKKDHSKLFEGVSFLNEDTLLYTDTKNYLEYSVFATGSYEPYIANLIKSQVKEGDVVFDVGANVGIHTITMANCAGKSGKVYAFEPIEFLDKRMKMNLWLNNIGNVEVVPFALSDQAGIEKVFFDENRSNLGTVSLADSHEEKNYSVEIKKGDDLIPSLGISQLNFMKIDVEGLEIKVLIGLNVAIEKFRPRIIFEYDRHYLNRMNKEKADMQHELFDFFHQKDYQLFNIEAHGLKSISDKFGFPSSGNIFAIPAS